MSVCVYVCECVCVCVCVCVCECECTYNIGHEFTAAPSEPRPLPPSQLEDKGTWQ